MMTMKLSKETKFMNILIGLSIKNPNFDPIFYNNGYQLEQIEPNFNNGDGNTINPDLQLKSHNDKNLLFFEIKCGSFEHEQALRYKTLTKEELVTQNVTSLDLTDSNFEFIYLCDSDSSKKLLDGDEKNNYGVLVGTFKSRTRGNISFCGRNKKAIRKAVTNYDFK